MYMFHSQNHLSGHQFQSNRMLFFRLLQLSSPESCTWTLGFYHRNRQLIPLYRLALSKFLNMQGLFKEGGNLFSETRESGSAITNRPGTNGLGNISPNSLEQSNVDIANEFVKMITTQRGFQANSKIITVTDEMLQDLINLKR